MYEILLTKATLRGSNLHIEALTARRLLNSYFLTPTRLLYNRGFQMARVLSPEITINSRKLSMSNKHLVMLREMVVYYLVD